MNIFLTGIMGSGKTTVGQELALKLGWTFVDTDSVIQVRSGQTISEIFRQQGEAVFRSLEKNVIAQCCKMENAVIALGGGALEGESTRNLVKQSGTLVWLRIDPEAASARLSNDETRPLLSDSGDNKSIVQDLQAILGDRADNYGVADLQISTDQSEPESIADSVIAQIELPDKKRKYRQIARTEEYGYDVIVDRGILSDIGSRLQQYELSSSAALISDTNVSELYANQIEKSVQSAGFSVHRKVLPAGEQTKNLRSLQELYSFYLQRGLDRQSPVIALGGGVIGDLAGYFAASYLRGVPLVHVPTSLLAQVDSSIGGKVGVNLSEGKNLVGAFYKPKLIFSDVNTLYTLPKREWQTGMGEVLKYGFIGNSEIFDLLKDGDRFSKIVNLCIQQKLDVVQRDFKESGLRRILNFGHTLGHALEQSTDYSVVTHGEAVYWGMIAAIYLSNQTGLLSKSDHDEALSILERFRFDLPEFDVEKPVLIQALQSDKKRLDGNIHWVLLKGIGKPVISSDVTAEQIENAIYFVNDFINQLKSIVN